MIGKLQDVLISERAKTGYSPVRLLLVKRKNREFCIDFDGVDIFSTKEVSLKILENRIKEMPCPEGGFIYLKRDVLDQQIVDTEDARVVRVNDLRLGKIKGELNVLGIGIGFKSLLRRLGLDKLDIFNIFKVNLIDWRRAELVKSGLKINTASRNLKTLHPADLANIIEDLTVEQGEELVKSMNEKDAAEVVEELDPELQKIMVNHLGPEKASKILEKMSIDEMVDLMRMFSKREAEELLSYLEQRQKKEVQELIQYDDDTAGGLMTTHFVKITADNTVNDVIKLIEELSPEMRFILYVYVVDDKGKLLGAVSMRKLLIEEETKKIGEIYKELSVNSVLNVNDKIDEITELMTKYNLFTAAVINDDGKLMGLVTIDDVMRELKPNA